MSEGHWTARSLARIECLKECMTPPSGTLGLSHLLIAAEAEFALVAEVVLYLWEGVGVMGVILYPLCCP